MYEIDVRSLTIERHGVRVISTVDLRVSTGEVIAIMGGTGAGKSTLALALCGLIDPTSGTVSIAERHERLAVAMVLQRPEATFLEENVIAEVMLAPCARGISDQQARTIAQQQLSLMGLGREYYDRDVLTLSGGEQRRAAIAATLATEAPVLVLDEPSAGLDYRARRHLHSAIQTLSAAGRTIILVTHDPDEAASLAQRLVVMRDGSIAWDGDAKEVLAKPKKAAELGIGVAPEVTVLHAVARAQNVTLEGDAARAATAHEAKAELARMLRSLRPIMTRPDVLLEPVDKGMTSDVMLHTGRTTLRAELAPLIDARMRIVATLIVIVAAVWASSLAASSLVVVCAAVVVGVARIDPQHVRIATRPLIPLTIALVALQMLVGGASQIELFSGQEANFSAAPALHRAMQASAIVLATLALSGSTTMGDLATGIRRLFSPLEVLRVPVGALSFVTATSVGLVPTLASELERLRLAQRARGLRRQGGGFFQAMKDDVGIMAPLFVAAFRRAHLLADALAVRGVDPCMPLSSWRPRHLPISDVLILVGSVVIAVLAYVV